MDAFLFHRILYIIHYLNPCQSQAAYSIDILILYFFKKTRSESKFFSLLSSPESALKPRQLPVSRGGSTALGQLLYVRNADNLQW